MNLLHKAVKPLLVVGAPRTGFTLLISLLMNLRAHPQVTDPLRQRMIKAFVETAGADIAAAVCSTARRAGFEDRLVFSPEFQLTTGGPKWLDEREGWCCVRKYVGIVGMGDFTLVVRYPDTVLERDPIVHSHVQPRRWLDHPRFGRRSFYVPIRDPLCTIASAALSLNALTSQYLQKFRRDLDQSMVREELALYKFSDLEFFRGLIQPLVAFLEELVSIPSESINIVRFEHIIERPVETLRFLSQQIGFPISRAQAARIWRRLRDRNLTGMHMHNYRPGGGSVDLWRRYLTGYHLDVIANTRLAYLRENMGYGPMPSIAAAQYTGFQNRLTALMDRGCVYHGCTDEDLFEFAFNKSNLDSKAFSRFKSYEWREYSRVERSSMRNENLLMDIWEAVDKAVSQFNDAFLRFLELPLDDPRAMAKIAERQTSAELRERLLREAMKECQPLRTIMAIRRYAEYAMHSLADYAFEAR